MQGVVVCSECKHAVLPGHVYTYLKAEGKHTATKVDQERIVREIQAIRGLKAKAVELNYLVFPPASSPPIPTLRPPKEDGLKYQL